MNESKEEKFAAALSETMQSRRRVRFDKLDRAAFEERFVAPFRKPAFSFFGPWIALGGAAATAAAVLLLNFFGHGLFSGKPLVAEKSFQVSRSGLWFGARDIVTASVFPGRDRVTVHAAAPTAFSWGNFATVTAAKAGLRLKGNSAEATSVEVISGKAVFRFAKSDTRRELVIAGTHALRITGTVVYVDADAQSIAILEGKTVLDALLPLSAGEEYDLRSGRKRNIGTDTRAAVRVLLPDMPAEEKTDNSPEARLFRMYGNAYAVTLRSGQRILAAKVMKEGNLQLFTLGGPLYVAENEIERLTKLR